MAFAARWFNICKYAFVVSKNILMGHSARTTSEQPVKAPKKNFTSNLYDYSLMEASSWADAQLSERSGRFYINQSRFMFGHALETQLVDSWTQLSAIDPAEFLPLLKESEGDLGRTGRLLSAALQSGATSVNTLEHLSNADDDFMAALFLNLPDGYRIEDAQKITDMGPEGRTAHLSGLMDQQGSAPIADAFVQASLNMQPNTFLESWLYDNKIFNSSNLGSDDELKKTLKDCIISSENAAALAVVRDHFGNWMDATLPGYFEERFTPQDRLNVVYNSDKVTFLESFIGTNGMAGITGSLVQIPGLTGLSYSNTIISGVSLGLLNPAILQYVNTPSPQNIDTDTLWLAEHHLYGSSRLGIKQYEPHQYRNVYSNTQSFVKGINVKQPWYSMGSEEMIKSGTKALPLLSTHYLADTFRYKRDLGTKYYELSDHLGNVLATVLDRKTGYGSLNGEYAGFRADVASATDYYPFGMEMPGRTYSSTTSRFGFNGQEKDNEVAGAGITTEFKYRSYDARIGRFKSIDPLSRSYPWNSSYAFAENRVVDGKDLEGREFEAGNDMVIELYLGKTVMQVQKGVRDGVDGTIEGAFNFVAKEAWKAGTWKNAYHSMNTVFDITFGNFDGRNDQLAHDVIQPKVDEFKDEVINGDAYSRSKYFTEVGIGFAVSYGVGKVAKIGFGVTTTPAPTVGIGAGKIEAGILNAGDVLRIENAATKIGKPITVVGSRASGTANAFSDWDYVIEGLNNKSWKKIKNSLPGSKSTLGNTPRNIDIFKSLDSKKPYITINPR